MMFFFQAFSWPCDLSRKDKRVLKVVKKLCHSVLLRVKFYFTSFRNRYVCYTFSMKEIVFESGWQYIFVAFAETVLDLEGAENRLELQKIKICTYYFAHSWFSRFPCVFVECRVPLSSLNFFHEIRWYRQFILVRLSLIVIVLILIWSSWNLSAFGFYLRTEIINHYYWHAI